MVLRLWVRVLGGPEHGGVRYFLESLRPGVTPETADAVLLVVSELVTNALLHGGGIFTLRPTAHPDLIEVAVDDPNPQAPCLRTPDVTGGFGWPMVKHLAGTTAVVHRPTGGKSDSAFLSR
ncbi:ATP-binding protein [Streptomyces anulatus]|uniref:ATP-binding protein n=1 Tax=Streptomyces anulatus TaxID=1892 RepID=UPI0033DC85BC